MPRLLRRQPDSEDEARAAHRAQEAEPAPRFDAGAAMLPAGRGSAVLRAATLQAMQQQAGNRAVQRWVGAGEGTAVQRIPAAVEQQDERKKEEEEERAGGARLPRDPAMSPALR